MTTIRISHLALVVVMFVCLALIVASLVDFRCIPVRTGDATVVVVCRASRLEARP